MVLEIVMGFYLFWRFWEVNVVLDGVSIWWLMFYEDLVVVVWEGCMFVGEVRCVWDWGRGDGSVGRWNLVELGCIWKIWRFGVVGCWRLKICGWGCFFFESGRLFLYMWERCGVRCELMLVLIRLGLVWG